MTYTIINYIILSHIYFGFIIEKIKYDDIKNIILLKELQGKSEIEISTFLLDKIFGTFNFIRKTLVPLLGINNIIIFMNSIFKEIYEKLINFENGDTEEKIINNEQLIDNSKDPVISKYSKYVKDYYEKEIILVNESFNNNINETQTIQGSNIYKARLFLAITEKDEFYNNKELINTKYPLLPYFTYSNYSDLNYDFKNQYLNFYYDSSKYPFITSILSKDPIFEIIEYLPKLNEFINRVQYEMNMRYTKEEINNESIDEKFNKDIDAFNKFIETKENIFGKNKKLEKNKKIFEIINLPGSIINSIYTKIIELYNGFLLKMKFIDKNIMDIVAIQEAKKMIIILIMK